MSPNQLLWGSHIAKWVMIKIVLVRLWGAWATGASAAGPIVSGAGFRRVEVDRHDFGKVADVQFDKHFGENVVEAVLIPLACLMAFDVA